MVPKDLFYKMAALALVAIILSSLLSLRSFALEDDYIDSGPPPLIWEGESPGELSGEEFPPPVEDDPGPEDGEDLEDLPEDEAPEPDEEDGSGDRQESESGTLLEEITQIRQMLELLICFVFPFICAVWLV